MRLTSSFAVFGTHPGEERLAKARWYGRDGRASDAEAAYRAALAEEPDLRTGWLELFELLRRAGRFADALEVARAAGRHFGPDAAMPRALEGAALTELGRTREAVAALEEAIERDGNLALAWHELAYAAFRAGEHTRALLVLDRAFALEPHTDTLMLRGRILRAAGQYDAAEVAFEAAEQSAVHDPPRREAEREILATRRAASLGARKPQQHTPREGVFVDTGAILLDAGAADRAGAGEAAGPDLLAECLSVFLAVAAALDWRPRALGGAEPGDEPLAAALASRLRIPALPLAALDPADQPLVVTVANHDARDWCRQMARLRRWKGGYSFALIQRPGVADPADVVGTRRGPHDPDAARLLLPRTLELLPADFPPPPAGEILALAESPLALWRARRPAAPA